MSFLNALKSMGLFQGGQQNPMAEAYGLDPAAGRQAAWQAIGNISGNLMALGQQMTPDQRARMMGQMDWSGGLQNSLYNQAQMKLMSDAQRRRQAEGEREELDQKRKEKVRANLASHIQRLPPGPQRDAAMYFFENDDLTKTGEIIFKRERKFDPMTGGEIEVDTFGNPISAQPNIISGGQLQVEPTSGGVSAPIINAPSGAPAAPQSSGAVPAMPAAPQDGEVDQLTTNWRSLLRDPSLTPVEARTIASQGSQKGAYDAYAEIVKNRQAQTKDQIDQDRMLTKDKSEMANTILDDRRSQMELPQRVVDFAQSIEDTLQMGDPTSMRALATQVLFAKVLDPGSAFMTGEADLQQQAASWSQRASRFLSSTTEGTPLPPELVLEMREISRKMGRRALTKLERYDQEATVRAKASGLSDEHMGGKFPLRWNSFADAGLDETGTSRREPSAQVLNDIENYGG